MASRTVRASSFCPKRAESGSARSGFERLLWAAAALISLVAFLPYAQTLWFGFIYDDYWTVVGNSHLDKPFARLLRATVSGESQAWEMPDATRPLMTASLWVDRRLFGLTPAGYHLDSACLYVLVSIAAGALSFALLRRYVAALAAGLAFAVAPLHAEVVAAVNYREDLLAALALFVSLTLLFWPTPRMAAWRLYGAAGLWLCALLAKESAFIGPLLFAALALVRRPPPALARQATRLGGAVVLLGMVWLVWRFGSSPLGEPIPRADHGSLLQTLSRTGRYEVSAALSSLFPIVARPEHAPLPAASPLWLLALLALPLLALGPLWRPKLRILFGAAVLALVAPLASSPLASPINEIADRYWFVGSLAGGLVAGWIAVGLARQSRLAVALFIVAFTLVGITASFRASSVWASEADLWTFAAETAPNSARAWSSLSRVHRLAGQDELAERAALRALEERPGYIPALVARVLNDIARGRVALGRERLEAIIAESKPQRDNLRVAARCASQPDAAAVDCVRRAVPRGMLLGDTERLRLTSTRLLERRK